MGKKKMPNSHPTCIIKVIEAIRKHSHFGRGASRSRIYKQIGQTYPGTLLAAARRAIQKGMTDGILIHGETTHRFKLTEKGKEFANQKLKNKSTAAVVKKIISEPEVAEKKKKSSIKVAVKKTLSRKRSQPQRRRKNLFLPKNQRKQKIQRKVLQKNEMLLRKQRTEKELKREEKNKSPRKREEKANL